MTKKVLVKLKWRNIKLQFRILKNSVDAHGFLFVNDKMFRGYSKATVRSTVTHFLKNQETFGPVIAFLSRFKGMFLVHLWNCFLILN